MKKAKTKIMTTKELDKKFDSGEEILSDFDIGTAIKKVNVDFPIWMVRLLDDEAKKLGIPRQAVIKTWINDRIESNKRSNRRSVG